jgi:predicted PurR-regulated permease PerM
VIASITPLVVDQVQGLIRSVPRSLDELTRLLQRLPFGLDLEASPDLRREIFSFSNRFGDRVQGAALGAAGNVVNIGATAAGIIVRLLAIGLVTFYLVADGPRFRQALARPLPPERQREMLAIWELAVAKTGGYIYSRLLIAVIAAVAHWLALVLLGVPWPLPLGVWMGVTTAFVPVVGVYLGGVLLLLVAAASDVVDTLWVLGFIVVYQQIENYVLAPKVQARTMELHPAVAFVAVLVGATLLGAVGALLALPVAAITKALLSSYVRRHQLIDELDELAPGEEPLPVGTRHPPKVRQ